MNKQLIWGIGGGLAGLVALVIVVALAFLIFSGFSRGERVLIVNLTESTSESFGMDRFDAALKNGGHISITIAEIRSRYPDFETRYAIMGPDGKFFTHGALINFVADRGWKFHSRDFGGIIFTKD